MECGFPGGLFGEFVLMGLVIWFIVASFSYTPEEYARKFPKKDEDGKNSSPVTRDDRQG